jgi:hyperosmotically inducible periplasmic protein
MRTPQLLCSTLVAIVAFVACERNTSDANAKRTSEQVKAAAVKAGHQLADSWLTTKIQAQYFADDDIKARHINVSTRDGVVTLTGFVDGEPQRDLAIQIARTTDGVSQVKDGLTLAQQPQDRQAVATTGTGAPAASAGPAASDTPEAPRVPNALAAANDAVTTARVQSKFFVDDRVKGRRIDVDTRDGVVTLSGQVADEDERAQALLLARTTEGVARVEDHLTVAPYTAPAGGQPSTQQAAPPDDATLTTTIQAKYFVDPTVKASAVEVSARDGVVVLQGSVANDAARKQAIAIAQNTGGVVQVIDRLTLPAAKMPPAKK